MSFSGSDEISEAMFEAGTSRTEKAEQERKTLQNVYAPMLCLTNWQRQTVSGSQNEEGKSAVSGSQNEREWVLERREYI